jgi:hypothetical protein
MGTKGKVTQIGLDGHRTFGKVTARDGENQIVWRRTLKWAWIEAVHGAVRSGGRFRQIFDRVTNGGKKDRNRGYIVVGHELCCLAYVLLKKDVDYRDDRPEHPGRRSKRSKKQGSRPRTGQPDHPMVAAAV